MSCDHIYEDTGAGVFCFECGRPQNAIHAAQEWINKFDHDFHQGSLINNDEQAARNIIEWLLDDLEKSDLYHIYLV